MTGVVALLAVAGVAGAFSLRKPGEAGVPQVQIGQSFPAVLPPSFDVVAPDPAPSAPRESKAPSLTARPTQSRVASERTPQRSTKTAAPTATGRADGPITAFSACSDGRSVIFAATFAEGFEYHHVFIDADGDASTGYKIDEVTGGFGADYLLENEYFYKSTGRDWAWREMDGASPLQSSSGGTYRWKLRADYAGVRAVFNGSDGADTEIFSATTPVATC
ncbi:hypothetical protein [Actinoplanes couchii]|uniref:Secreted protein n=1 Tax=Actinoplanes couchii TaxID=403638 RepID=A0ABQ3XKS2_9ACTN|nr:hypothetical protein [Actinoplanes couchii]MDR6319515.1 hypothetical protein [Actinoplanes couchii]GID59096.1 hypothetical protein Aco03nite_075000 [Actinoplanes couchii]